MPDVALILLRKTELLGPSTLEGQALLKQARRLLTSLGMRAEMARANALLRDDQRLDTCGPHAAKAEALRHLPQGKTD